MTRTPNNFKLHRKYVGKARSTEKMGAQISIHRSGSLGIGGDAHQLLRRAPYVEFLFDEQRGMLALRAATADSQHAFKLSEPTRTSYVTVQAKRVLDAYGVDYSKLTRHTPHAEHGMLCIDLSNLIHDQKEN